MNLSELQADLRHFAAERDWQPFHTPKNLSTALMVESAELAEIFQWMTPEESAMAHQDAGMKQSISDEVADVLLYLLQVADRCEINIEQAVRDKLARNGLKHPVKRQVARVSTTRASAPGTHVLLDVNNPAMTDPGSEKPAFGWPAWPLPLLAGLLPLTGTAIAYTLSVRLGLIEACNPFIEGCVSISRAARHGLPNHLFRALLLPAAALQALCWLLCGAWLRTLGAAPTRKSSALPWVGLAAALFLVMYGAFLGTEGEAYRWMRRYGVMLFFGGTCIAMLIVSGASQGLVLRARHVARALPILCMALPLLGLANVFAPLFHADNETRDALQNSTEWWGALIFTLFFAAMAWMWRATRFEINFASIGNGRVGPG